MKFKVRDGFVLKRVDYEKSDDGSVLERTTSAYSGDTIDLSAEQALEHLHQLEPVDKEAKALVESRFVPSAALTSVAGGVGADVSAAIQQAIADGIKAGLAAAAEASAAAAAASTPASAPAQA